MNIDLLERQVETDQNRLEKGEINLTDLAQSEASLAGARAELIAAQNDLVTSRANFEKIIGEKPTQDIQEIKEANLNLPESLAVAYSISHSGNPDLQIALLEYKQAKLDVVIAGSDLSPSATLSYKIMLQKVRDRNQQSPHLISLAYILKELFVDLGSQNEIYYKPQPNFQVNLDWLP